VERRFVELVQGAWKDARPGPGSLGRRLQHVELPGLLGLRKCCHARASSSHPSFVNSIINYIDFQVQTRGRLVSPGRTGAILGHVLGYVVAGAAGLFLIARSLRTLKPKSGGGGFVENLKLMIGYGYPLYLSSLASIFIGQLQLILLAFFVSNFEVGNFNAAVNLTTLLTILITPMATAIFPAFSTFSSRQAELKRFFGSR
jgi:hypothetical protein